MLVVVGEIFKKTRALLGNYILEQFSIIENKKIEKKKHLVIRKQNYVFKN